MDSRQTSFADDYRISLLQIWEGSGKAYLICLTKNREQSLVLQYRQLLPLSVCVCNV